MSFDLIYEYSVKLCNIGLGVSIVLSIVVLHFALSICSGKCNLVQKISSFLILIIVSMPIFGMIDLQRIYVNSQENPKVASCEVRCSSPDAPVVYSFVDPEDYRTTYLIKLPFSEEYVHPGLDLDRRKTYRVWYDEDIRIILKIEEIEES